MYPEPGKGPIVIHSRFRENGGTYGGRSALAELHEDAVRDVLDVARRLGGAGPKRASEHQERSDQKEPAGGRPVRTVHSIRPSRIALATAPVRVCAPRRPRAFLT
jgi:hypothetical protein